MRSILQNTQLKTENINSHTKGTAHIPQTPCDQEISSWTICVLGNMLVYTIKNFGWDFGDGSLGITYLVFIEYVIGNTKCCTVFIMAILSGLSTLH